MTGAGEVEHHRLVEGLLEFFRANQSFDRLGFELFRDVVQTIAPDATPEAVALATDEAATLLELEAIGDLNQLITTLAIVAGASEERPPQDLDDFFRPTDLVETAAAWLAQTPLAARAPRIGIIQRRFGLSIGDAARAIRMAAGMKGGDHEGDGPQ